MEFLNSEPAPEQYQFLPPVKQRRLRYEQMLVADTCYIDPDGKVKYYKKIKSKAV